MKRDAQHEGLPIYAQRLRAELERQDVSQRELARRLEERAAGESMPSGKKERKAWRKRHARKIKKNRPTGGTYGGLRLYLEGEVERPREKLFEEIAAVLEEPVLPAYLLGHTDERTEAEAALRNPVERVHQEWAEYRSALERWITEEFPSFAARQEYVKTAVMEAAVAYRSQLPQSKPPPGTKKLSPEEFFAKKWRGAEEAARATGQAMARSLDALRVDLDRVDRHPPAADQLDRFIMAFISGMGALFPRLVVKPAPLLDPEEESQE